MLAALTSVSTIKFLIAWKLTTQNMNGNIFPKSEITVTIETSDSPVNLILKW